MFCVVFVLLVLGVEAFHPITLTNAKQSSLFENDTQWQVYCVWFFKKGFVSFSTFLDNC